MESDHNNRIYYQLPFLLIAVVYVLAWCARENSKWETVEVTATAYVMDASREVVYGAWGNALDANTKCIAVSKDLEKSGLTQGVMVKIKGLEGEYEVLDRMAPKWEKKIDIFMGKDRERAIQWGNRKVLITYVKK